jgi:hypothetical protein
LKVAILCEFSGIVRDEFIKAGHDAISCDLEPSEKPGPHIRGDLRDYNWSGYDLIIAHPPCTYLSNAGVQYLYKQKDRWKKMKKAVKFFKWIWNLSVNKMCIENPVPHRYVNICKYTQIIQPYQFGHNKSKRTCLWLKNLPLLLSTNIVDKGEFYKCGNGGTNPKWYSTSSKNRSRFFPGIAKAMAEQWG